MHRTFKRHLRQLRRMDKAKLISTLKKLLNVENNLTFLDKLTLKELQVLIAYIRDRIDNPPKTRH